MTLKAMHMPSLAIEDRTNWDRGNELINIEMAELGGVGMNRCDCALFSLALELYLRVDLFLLNCCSFKI